MPFFNSPRITLYFESFGKDTDPAILLIMGLGAQYSRWNTRFCELLAQRGFRVIRFDNRDCGLSTHFDTAPLPDIAGAIKRGQPLNLAYTLEDMAQDALDLLDSLGIRQAHFAGASMGGAIAQIIAARHPARALSLTSIMSSSGNPMLPPPTPAAAAALFAPLPLQRDRASMVADGIARFLPVSSPDYPTPQADLEAMFGNEYDRAFYPQGVARQLGAIFASGDRRPLLKTIKCPTVVLHGAADPLIPLACGVDVCANITGAEMITVPGMGHDFPEVLDETFADAICRAAARVQAKG
ncbi:MAG: alpha/beta hydrolase [Zoogloeaceae bacterium]|nr:alpha/beta hydrolase [Zoogloeaceae bacterium]